MGRHQIRTLLYHAIIAGLNWEGESIRNKNIIITIIIIILLLLLLFLLLLVLVLVLVLLLVLFKDSYMSHGVWSDDPNGRV